MKTCTKCGEEKSLERFSKNKACKDGLQFECKECHKLRSRIWRSENRERYLEYQRKWYESNKDNLRGKQRQYYENNPGKHRAKEQRRRALKLEATTEQVTPDDLVSVWGEDPSCYYCSAPFEHWDHFYPLSRGGNHSLDNLVPACAPCNLRKRARDPYEFIRETEMNGTDY